MPLNPKVEAIIRPVVEGQIRSFLNDHPEILDGCKRHKHVNKTPTEWIKDSLSKRIVRDLAGGILVARLASVLCQSECNTDEKE